MRRSTLVKTLETELGGLVETAAMFMLGMKLKPYEEVAKLIKEACKSFGTDELFLTTVLIRYQTIMKEVMVAHVELYGKTVGDRINSETGGDYKKVLMQIVETAEE
jgi:hypothetical protein